MAPLGKLMARLDIHEGLASTRRLTSGPAKRRLPFPAVIRLYRAPFSTNVERVALALAHKGLAVESVIIDYSDRSEVECVSGQALVPVIEDDGTVVVDSMEIVRYLEERYPVAPLYPADEARGAEMLIFIDWFDRIWKAPPNEIEAQLAKPDPAHERVAHPHPQRASTARR